MIEVFMIHFFERFGGVHEHELELLVPDVLTQLIPLHLIQSDDHLIIETVELHAVPRLIHDDLRRTLPHRCGHLIVDLSRDPD